MLFYLPCFRAGMAGRLFNFPTWQVPCWSSPGRFVYLEEDEGGGGGFLKTSAWGGGWGGGRGGPRGVRGIDFYMSCRCRGCVRNPVSVCLPACLSNHSPSLRTDRRPETDNGQTDTRHETRGTRLSVCLTVRLHFIASFDSEFIFYLFLRLSLCSECFGTAARRK